MNQFKRKLTAFSAMLAFLSLSSAATFADVVTDTQQNLLGKTGNMETVNTSSNRLDVNIVDNAGAVGQVDWKDFSINAGNHVNFGFSGLSQTIINRVLGGKTSEIMGRMTSSCIGTGTCSSYNETSKVLFINPAGVLFGQGSQVDINSLTTSTFDMNGAQNLQGMSPADMTQYQNDILNRASALKHTVVIDGKVYNMGTVELDSNYTDAFKAAGLTNADKMIKNSSIKMDGATFSHWARDSKNNFDFDNELTASPNKSLAFVANKIDYKDSLIRTGLNYNYVYKNANGQLVPSSYSNVKLITADGVSFNYLNNGYVDSQTLASEDQHPDTVRTINMDNSGLIAKDPSKEAIIAGDINIQQRSQVANGNQPSVKIKDTIIKGYKLVNRENGDIEISASQDILVDHSRLETDNTSVTYAGTTATTLNRHGGEVYIAGDKDVTVADSTIITSGSEGTAPYSENSGAVRILSGTGTAKVDGTKILADGHAKIKSSNKVDINNSLVQAYNTVDTTTEKDVTIVGAKGVTITNTDSNSKGDIIVLAGDEVTGELTGDIVIKGDSNKTIAQNDPNQPVMKSAKAISIKGKNTTIDDVTLAYNQDAGLEFYDSTKSGSAYTNNVTIKNNAAFTPFTVDASGKEQVVGDVTIETNGDLTFDHATVKRAEIAIKMDRKDAQGHTGYNLDPSNPLNDDGSIDGITYQTKANPNRVDAVNLNIKSTNGNIKVTNGSNINAKNNNTVVAAKGSYTQDAASTMSAGNDISITADKDVSISDSSTVQGGNDAKVTSKEGNITVNNSKVLAIVNDAELAANAGTISLANNAQVEAGNDANVKGKKGVTIDKSNVIAGSDKEGYDKVKDANDTIGDANIIADSGSVVIKNGSNVKSQDKNVNITASKDVTSESSTITATNDIVVNAGEKYTQSTTNATAGRDIKVTAGKDATVALSTIDAGNDAIVKSTAGNVDVDGSDILAKAGNASLIASAGEVSVNEVEIEGNTRRSRVEAGNDVNLEGYNMVDVSDSDIIAGSDSEGFDKVNDPNDTIGDVNIKSENGSVFITDNSKVLSQDKDILIQSKNSIKFGPKDGAGVNIDKTANIKAEHNVKIKSTAGDIQGEKTTMPTIKYGDRLTFDAAENNIFTSEDSLKSVNVDYIAGKSNKFYTQGDIQFVNSSLESPKNFVESGKDVILNNLEIKNATDNPKDTVTEIYANGNVTTYNVTGEDLGAKGADGYHSYPQSVKADRVAKGDKTMPEYVKGLESTKLNINDTKLKVTTDTVKDDSNPDNGSITLVVKNADNKNAGVELKARNVDALDKDPITGDFREGYYKTGTPKWDENIKAKQGPEIVLDAADGKIAIKELYSDKLTLDPNDKMFADKTDGTPTITIKDQGGFNLDPELDYRTDSEGKRIGDGYEYTKDYDSKDIRTTGGDLILDPDWSDWVPTGESWDDPDGTHHEIYESTRDGRVTDRITTKTDQKHTITFDNDHQDGEFTLVYDKKSTEVDPGFPITAEQVKDDPSVIPPDVRKPDGSIPTIDDFVQTKDETTPCPPPPPAPRTDDNPLPTTDDVSKVTLPREQVEVSRTSTVVDNTADQTSNIMSAAARVDLNQEIDADYDDDDDDIE